MNDRSQFNLSPREMQVLTLVVDQLLSNREIADQLGIVEQVAKKHVEHIYSKVGILGSARCKRTRLWRMFRVPTDKVKSKAVFTDKEWVMMMMTSEGATNREIAERLQTSEGSVKNKMREIFDRTGMWKRLELAAWVDSHYRPEVSCAAD